MKNWKAKMKISEEKDLARAVPEILQRQISQECGLVKTSDPEDRSSRPWVSPSEDAVKQPPSQERAIREMDLIPKKSIAGEGGHRFNEGGKILSARERSHRYDICGQSFKQKSEVTEHQKIDNIKKIYECKECGKTFNRGSSLIIHQRIHSGKKPYVCNECGKDFNQSSNLIIHQRIHTGKKPYICHECGKNFNQSSNLVRHKRIHSGENPYECKECGKAFKGSSNLVLHQRLHSGGNHIYVTNVGRPSIKAQIL